MRLATQWGWYMSFLRVSIRKSLMVLAAATLLLTLSLSSGSETANAGPSIDVGDNWFCDASHQFGVCVTNVTIGALVTWTWVGGAPHNVVADDFSSATQTTGTFARSFDTPGEYFYLCTVHPAFMQGTIVVSGTAVGGIAELPGLSSSSQLDADAGGDRSVLIGAIVAATLVSMTVAVTVWLTFRRRA